MSTRGGESPESERLLGWIGHLAWIGRVLRNVGMIVFVLTALNVFFTIYVLSTGGRVFLPPDAVSFVSVVLALIVFLLVALFEAARKRGSALFDEISDELQWNVRSGEIIQGNQPTALERPGIDVRIMLRAFARATDLPLVPGKYGPAIFTALNLALSMAIALLLRSGFLYR